MCEKRAREIERETKIEEKEREREREWLERSEVNQISSQLF